MGLRSRPSFDSRAADPNPLPTRASIPVPKPTNNPTTPLRALTHHVQAQCTQARDLFAQTAPRLSPTQREWMEATIADTESTTQEILRLTESFRVEEAVRNGRVGIRSQVRWLLRDSRKAREKRERLVLCHGSLMGVLAQLRDLHHGRDGQTQPSLATGMSWEWTAESGAVDAPVSPLATESPYGSGSGYELGPGTHTGRSRADSPPWDLAMQLQDAGMEVAGSEAGPRSGLMCTKVPSSVTLAHGSMVKLPVQERTRPSSIVGNASVLSCRELRD